MADIDRNSPIPIYHQLKSLILEQIQSGLWRSGDRIPTEQELCRLYSISRAPVRQALSELAREGVLSRRPGLGTFVNSRRIEVHRLTNRQVIRVGNTELIYHEKR